MKDVQAKIEAFSLLKENIQHFKTWKFFLFFYFFKSFCYPGSGPDPADQNQLGSMRTGSTTMSRGWLSACFDEFLTMDMRHRKNGGSLRSQQWVLHTDCQTFRESVANITINVPLFKKLRDIIFFCGTITLWAISRDILRGPRLFWPLKLSRAQQGTI